MNNLFKSTVKHTVKDKDYQLEIFRFSILNKTQQIFKYTNLPLSIPARILEQFLQINGQCFFTKIDEAFYVFVGNQGGEPDVYYEGSKYVVANPKLKVSKEFDIDKDGVMIRNDSYCQGLLPLIDKYGIELIESDISLHVLIKNMRSSLVFAAYDDKWKKSIEDYLTQRDNGTDCIISGQSFVDNPISLMNSDAVAKIIPESIQLYQFIKCCLYNELGLTINNNMKREYVNEAEMSSGDMSSLTLIDNMLKERQEAINKINALFDLDIKVELNNAWQLQVDKVNAEINELEGGSFEESESDEEIYTDDGRVDPDEPDDRDEPEEQEDNKEKEENEYVEEIEKEEVEEAREEINEVKD